MRKVTKKLALMKSTIRHLDTDVLGNVIGGGTALCPSPPTNSAQCVSVGCLTAKCEPTPTAGCDTHS